MTIYQDDYEPKFGIFHDLMKFRVREILLVSSFYDAFVMEEDGRLRERIMSEYLEMNLHYIPRITRVSSGEEAISALKASPFDLVITMTRISDMNLLEFGKRVKKIRPGISVILLSYEWIDTEFLVRLRKARSIDKVFYWTGDTRMFLAIIKYIEDLKNADIDSQLGVHIILLIEDSPKFYSMYLPILYTVIMKQSQRLITEGVNDLHRMLRMRARPKILMAETYEEGKKLYRKYKDKLLGIISDVRYPRKGEIDELAGLRFGRRAKKEIPDLPILLQSSNIDNQKIANKYHLEFLHKNSQNLLLDLHNFVLSHFGFGDFVFKNAKGEEIDRAGNLQEFEEKLLTIPDESIEYHATRNHISIWMRARTEFEAAERLRPIKLTDFSNIEEARKSIAQEIQTVETQHRTGVIADFGQTSLDFSNLFIRLGSGSLGGKARSIAFLNLMLSRSRFPEKFPGVEIRIPHTFVICSEVFEKFINENNLQEFSIRESRNDAIARRFLRARFPRDMSKNLLDLLKEITYPIAVRSSSILEDSQMLPFAGLYSTYMLPNNHPNIGIRLKQLQDAIKLVFASVFYKSPKEYVKNTHFRIEEEKMAVIIQQVVGQEHQNKFYPVISGTAQSYNFYPISHMEAEDGVVQMALGLGIIVVEGGPTYRISPKYPEISPPYKSETEFLRKSQNYFYAIDLLKPDCKIINDEKFSLRRCELAEAETDGTLFFVGSTYCSQDSVIKDTLWINGARVITFANVLKYNVFPLAEIMKEILKIGRKSFGSHIEMEFAVNIFKDKTRKPEFYLLQIRPMVTGREDIEVAIDKVDPRKVFCSTTHSMGNGVLKDITDVVYVDPDTFEVGKSRIIASEVGEINKMLSEENRHYVLIGFGRWGTADPWLGIPVEWYQISNARVIIESTLDGFIVDPSQGSHFFHNLTSLGLGYFHIRKKTADEFIDWEFLKSQPVFTQAQYVKHVRFSKPVIARINARNSRGIIFKPGEK